MKSEIKSLFNNVNFDDVSSVAVVFPGDIAAALSLVLAQHDVVLVHLLYPNNNSGKHESQQTLVHVLHTHGLHSVARLVEDKTQYLLFSDPAEAWNIYQEIRNASLSIDVHLYFCGLTGNAAEHKLEERAHQEAKSFA